MTNNNRQDISQALKDEETSREAMKIAFVKFNIIPSALNFSVLQEWMLIYQENENKVQKLLEQERNQH